VRGSGGDEDVLRGAGAEMTDLLMALTEGDNRNAMAAQLGKHVFGIPRVIAKINDPVRAEAYRSLGLETICRTVILADALVLAAADGADATDGQVEAPTAEPLRGAPVGGSKAAEEAEEAEKAAEAERAAEADERVAADEVEA
jgi:Trk K+ transport system NAD-binding subunit